MERRPIIEGFVHEFVRHYIDEDVGPTDFIRLLAVRKKLEPAPAVDDRNKISYYPVGDRRELPENHGTDEVRQRKAKMMRPGRFIQALFPDMELGDSVRKRFAEKYQEKFGEIDPESYTMEIWKCVRDAYDDKNFAEENGSELWNSCMNNKLDFIQFWEMIGVKVLVCLNEDNRIVGRSLVWEGVKDFHGNEYTFMDRVYTHSQKWDKVFLDYAVQNGWIYKDDFKSAGVSHFIDSSGERHRMDLFYKINLGEKEIMSIAFPYSDTLQHLSDKLDNLNTSNGIGMLDNTDGENPIGGEVVIDVDGYFLDLENEEAIMIGGDWYPIDHRDIVKAITGINAFRNGFNFDYMHVDDVVFSDAYDSHIEEECAVFVEDEEDYVLDSDTGIDKDGNTCIEGNIVYSEIYGDFISEAMAEDHPEFGLIYPDDLTEVEIEDYGPEGNGSIKVEAVDGYTFLDGQIVEVDRLVACNGILHDVDEEVEDEAV